MSTKSQLAIIHLAKKQLGLDDETYRAILSGADVYSAKDITTELQFNTVMGAFMKLGFLPAGHKVKKYQRAVSGKNPNMISKPQEYYIKGLWALASRVKDEKSLLRMVKRIGKVDDISFLTRKSASALIQALRDICWKAGYNPDSKEEPYVMASREIGKSAASETSSSVLSCANGKNRGGQGWGTLETGTGSSAGL